MTIRFLDRHAVSQCLSMREAIELMRVAFSSLTRGDIESPLRTPLTNEAGTILYKPCYWREKKLFCQKIVSVFPGNSQKGLPVTTGLLQANSGGTGLPQAILDAEYITSLRTGAATGLAIDLLSPGDVQRGCLMGTGGQAPHQLEAMLAVRDFESIVVASRDPANARRFCEQHQLLAKECPLKPAGATPYRDCQVVVTATTSPTPIVTKSELPDEVMISAVGSLGRNRSEIAAEVVLAGEVFVDQRAACLAEAGEFATLLEEGRLPSDFAPAELGELLLGTRTPCDSPIRLFKSVGNAAQDVVCVAKILEVAEERELGQTLEL